MLRRCFVTGRGTLRLGRTGLAAAAAAPPVAGTAAPHRALPAACALHCATRLASSKPPASGAAQPKAAASSTASTTANTVATIPNLNFLSRPENLLETVEPTIAMCEALLNEIPKVKTVQEKHDLIDSTSNILCLLLDPCEFVRQIHPDPRYRMNADLAFQKGFEYMATVNSRQDLYEVIKELNTPAGHKALDAESVKNVIQLRRDMENNGIHLPDKARAKVVEMNIENEMLAMRLLEARQGSSSASPYITLTHLLRSRYELARLLGFESYAQKQLQGKMLDTQEKVWHFLCGIVYKYRGDAEREMGVLRQHIGEVRNRENITDQVRAYVSAAVLRDAMPEAINEYFSVANCIRGIQCLCAETFGVKLQEVPFNSEEVFHPAAKKFHVYDDKGGFLGVILLDMYMNSSKHCSSGHLTLQLGCIPHQSVLSRVHLQLPARQYPVVALTCNVGSQHPPHRNADGSFNDEMTPMNWNEVVTFFHEFGHAMHTIFGQTRVQNLAGTRSSVDFVETFSQLFEQFLTSHEFLRLWAHRMNTREPISRDLVERRNAAATMFKQLDMFDQVLLSATDQTLHGPQPMTVYFPNGAEGSLGKRTLGDLTDYGRGTFNFAKVLLDVAKPLSIATPTEEGVLRSLSMEHMCSYPADYYGYLYSLRVAQRIYDKKFARNPVNRAAGQELVEKVMRYGAACDPRTTIEEYLKDDLDDTELWA